MRAMSVLRTSFFLMLQVAKEMQKFAADRRTYRIAPNDYLY
jgi:hypothetical protein